MGKGTTAGQRNEEGSWFDRMPANRAANLSPDFDGIRRPIEVRRIRASSELS
jgi:hypothetical protein